MRALSLLLLACTLGSAPARAARPAHHARMPEVEPPVPPVPDDASPELRHGALLYRAAGCVGCHSPPFRDATHLGGGRDLPTAFGVFWAPNISPDPVDGIGSWSEADFERAMRRGRAPDGHRYWPTFPYMAYTHLTDADVHALWVYLRASPPVPGRPPEHEIRSPYRLPGALGAWRTLGFHRGPLDPEPEHGPEWSRGAYLVRAVGYCDQCHTPRNRIGLLKRRHFLAGGANPGKGELHPNLTPHGLAAWSLDDLVAFLSTGEKPDGSRADPHQVMDEKIRDSYSWLPDSDKRAIAVFLASLPPDDYDPTRLAQRHASRGQASAGGGGLSGSDAPAARDGARLHPHRR